MPYNSRLDGSQVLHRKRPGQSGKFLLLLSWCGAGDEPECRRKRFSVEDHALATQGVECRKDAGVIDETPAAYKNIDAVMAAQSDLVQVVYCLKQILCIKG